MANDGENRHVQEEKSGDEFRDESAVEGPTLQLLDVDERRWRRVRVILGRERSRLRRLHVLAHRRRECSLPLLSFFDSDCSRPMRLGSS